MRAAGECYYCRGPVERPGTRCLTCAEKDAARVARYWREKRAAAST